MPGADEDDAAALPQRLGDDLHADRDALLLALDRGEHLAVLVQHPFDDVGGGELVDGERGGVDRSVGSDCHFERTGMRSDDLGTSRGYYHSHAMVRTRVDVDAYLDHLRVERRLADHTLESYARDLAALAAVRRRRRPRARGARSPGARGSSSASR